MGAWGTGNWQNDTALDWIIDVHDVEDLEDALAGPTDDSHSCCEALAAAEVIAACFGRPAADQPEEAEAWVAANKQHCPRELAAIAANTVRRIQTSSDLQELFDENGLNAEWRAVLLDLRSRLSAVGTSSL